MKYLKFEGSWCQPCQKLKPIMENVKKTGIPVETVDVDENSILTSKYNIRSVPTVILVKDNGEEINRIVGLKDENTYISNYNNNK